MLLVLVGLCQHFINGVQEVVPHHVESVGPPLSDLDEVVNEDIGVCEGAIEGHVGRRRHFVLFGRQVRDA